MDSAEFDQFAEEYTRLHARNISASGESPEFFARYKVSDVAEEQLRRGRQTNRILDFGAGIGSSVPHWSESFPLAKLVCLDVSERSLALGSGQFGKQATFCSFDGETIPFASGSFDVAFAACVFHHIPETLHVSLFRELRRVLARDGALYIFEHNPLNPLTRRAVDTCEFDRNAVLIRAGLLRERLREAGFRTVDIAYRIFFPGMLRALRPMERALRWLPLGAQYRAVAHD